MAIVGQMLTSPEVGWKRYDDNDVNFNYIGDWIRNTSANNMLYNGYHNNARYYNLRLKFNFTGTKIRIIGDMRWNKSESIPIYIDNVKYFINEYSQESSQNSQKITFEKTGLINMEHSVEIIFYDNNSWFSFDAIDIDGSGILKPFYSKPLFLLSDNDSNLYSLSYNEILNLNTKTLNEDLFKNYGFANTSLVSQNNVDRVIVNSNKTNIVGTGVLFETNINILDVVSLKIV